MTEVAGSYALALYELAIEEDQSCEILSQLKAVEAVCSNEPDFFRLMSIRSIALQERLSILDDCFRDKIHPYVLNFLKILTEKGVFGKLSSCVKAYTEHYNRDHGIVEVLAVTAVALTEEQLGRLRQKLEAITGKTVELKNRIDTGCLGGVRLDYDGKRFDGTVQNRLDAIRKQLNNTVL